MVETTILFKDSIVHQLHADLVHLSEIFRADADDAGVQFVAQFVEQVEDNSDRTWEGLMGEMLLSIQFAEEPASEDDPFFYSGAVLRALDSADFSWNSAQVADRPFANELSALLRDTSCVLRELGDEEGWETLNFYSQQVAGFSNYPSDLLVEKVLDQVAIARLIQLDVNKAHLDLVERLVQQVADAAGLTT